MRESQAANERTPRLQRPALAILALFIGGLLYVAFRPSRLLMFDWIGAIGLASPLGTFRTFAEALRPAVPDWAIYSLPQALWGFALVSLLRWAWIGSRGLSKAVWLTSAVALALGPEMGQATRLVPGTFDAVDLTTLVVAIATAFVPLAGGSMKKHLFSAFVLGVFALFAVGSSDTSRNTAGGGIGSGGTSAVSEAPVASLTAADLLDAYSDNEVRADSLYKGKVITVTGKVDNVGKDILDNMYISIAGSNEYSIFSVQAFFDKEHGSRLANYSKGDRVSVTCRCDGKFGNVLLKGCRF